MPTFRRKRIFLSFLFLILMSSRDSFAMDRNPVIKFARGIENILDSPLEFPIQYVRLLNQGQSGMISFIAGAVYGTGAMIGRIAGGAVEAVTFLIPAPPHYEPLMKPATPSEELRKLGPSPKK